MDKIINICHLYPDVLNLYGDRGNIMCMKRRLQWRGIQCEVTELPIGATADFTKFDLFFIGGGQDFEQEVLLEDLRRSKASEIKAAVKDGKTFLCICGGFQMLGNYYETFDGHRCEFIGAVDYYTVGSQTRMIGDYCFKCGESSGGSTVVGFENHSGRTYLAPGVQPLGTIIKGNGNNGSDGSEGVRYNNVFGTYAHGPVLPKNPEFCDYILRTALWDQYPGMSLETLGDQFEKKAHDYMKNKILPPEK